MPPRIVGGDDVVRGRDAMPFDPVVDEDVERLVDRFAVGRGDVVALLRTGDTGDGERGHAMRSESTDRAMWQGDPID